MPTSKEERFKTPFETEMSRDNLQETALSVAKILNAMPPMNFWQNDPSTKGTPDRFAKYLAEFCQPIDIEGIFKTFGYEDDGHSMIIQTNIPFRMCCEHHLLPAVGKASIGYIPDEKVIGLSKLCRLVDAVGVERPSLQEKIASRIVALLKHHLKPKGIMVVIKAEHGCMACRGVTKPNVPTITSNVQGLFLNVDGARAEMLSLIQQT